MVRGMGRWEKNRVMGYKKNVGKSEKKSKDRENKSVWEMEVAKL